MKIPTISVLVPFFALIGACQKKAPTAAPQMPPAVVTAITIQTTPYADWEELAARVIATDRVDLTPRVSGVIEKIFFQAGQVVKKDDVLYEIDAATYSATHAMTKAKLARAEANLAQAKSEAQRVPELVAAQAMTTEEAEMRQSKALQAQADLAAAQAEHELAGIDLQRTKVLSPITGRISRTNVTAGNQVSPSTVLTNIVSIDPVHVYAEINEGIIHKARQALLEKKVVLDDQQRVPVELRLSGQENTPLMGWLESLDNRVMPGTGTLALRAIFPNKSETLVDGMFARIRIPLSAERPAILIPETALKTDQGKKFVYVIDEKSTAQYRPVTLGSSTPKGRVILNGLSVGDKVIVNGLAKIFMPGMPVNPQPQP